jgi:hypothetical protein
MNFAMLFALLAILLVAAVLVLVAVFKS